MYILQVFTYVRSNVSTVITFSHLVFFLIIVILKRKCVICSRFNFFMHTLIEIITYRISYSCFLLKSTFVLIRNTKTSKITLIDHNLSSVVLLNSMIVILSLFFRIIQRWTFMFATKLPRYLYKLRTWVSHLSDLLILMWWINLILRNQHVVLMLWIETSHVFTVSNNTTIRISNYHLFRISTRLNSLRNMLNHIMSCRIYVNSVKTGIVRLWRLPIIKRIRLQMMSSRGSFVHIWNLILIFLIIWRLNRLWNSIYQFILL